MDTLIYSVLRITVMILILRTILRLFSYPRSKKFRMNLRRQDSEMQNDESESTEPADSSVDSVEMVMDKTSRQEIPKHRAYILVDDQDQAHYFSSWECRQQFIAGKQQS